MLGLRAWPGVAAGGAGTDCTQALPPDGVAPGQSSGVYQTASSSPPVVPRGWALQKVKPGEHDLLACCNTMCSSLMKVIFFANAYSGL